MKHCQSIESCGVENRGLMAFSVHVGARAFTYYVSPSEPQQFTESAPKKKAARKIAKSESK